MATPDLWSALRTLAQDLGPLRPRIGQQCKVMRGKHAGLLGIISWHGRDRFANDRYVPEASRHLRDILGRHGFRVGFKTADGRRVFVPAEYVVTSVGEDGSR